ncbi:MAG: hypothetical protein K6A37_00350 [Saccharofermentans sp.]|nr:hypothetical protein [Saccharofermentans sp.]
MPDKRKPKVPNIVLSNERATYENMTKDELIDALILSKANTLRAEMGYEVRINEYGKKKFYRLNGEEIKD